MSQLNAVATYDQANLPPSLAGSRMKRGPLVPLGAAAFTATSEEEALLAAFATWNMLDAIMFERSRLIRERRNGSVSINVGRAHSWQTGYVREVQLRRMVQLVREPHVKHYCEVGMNGGHSVSAMLLANPSVKAHVFDVMKLKYSWPVASLLEVSFRDRFELHAGLSGDTLPGWVADFAGRNGSRCDLILIDGDHTEAGARADLKILRQVASPTTRFVFDDINMPPGRALASEVRRGAVQVLEQYGPFPRRSAHSPCMRVPAGDPRGSTPAMCPKWGYAVARYLPS